MDSRAFEQNGIELKRRVAAELFLFIVGSALYLGLWRHRPGYADMSFGFVGLGLVFLFAWWTHARIWGEPLPDARLRMRQSCWAMVLSTSPVVLIFAIVGAYLLHGGESIVKRFFRPDFFLALAFYFLYALFQQALFQYYLLGRLKVLMPGAPVWALALLNGVLYGAMHLNTHPDWILFSLTVGGGIVWTLTYHRWRVLLPLAISHAILGATYFYWIRDDDKMAMLLEGLKGMGH